jgi:hypothetical protein
MQLAGQPQLNLAELSELQAVKISADHPRSPLWIAVRCGGIMTRKRK